MELSKEYLALKKAARTNAKTLRKATSTAGPKTLKSCTIEGAFPELGTGRMYQVGRGRGTNIKAAAGAAIRDLLKQPGLKAQRFTACKATISFGTVTVSEEGQA